ncbi:hypothetical protein [Pseudomonas sp.]|uniref:hypothetical protein n=1 Tax=Pseudomonas sp. TaxID=306 RepID=UPI00262D1F1A|nr:hypothetical protein [Pseudomonas sp.]
MYKTDNFHAASYNFLQRERAKVDIEIVAFLPPRLVAVCCLNIDKPRLRLAMTLAWRRLQPARTCAHAVAAAPPDCLYACAPEPVAPLSTGVRMMAGMETGVLKVLT